MIIPVVARLGSEPRECGAQEYVEDCEVCCNPWQVKVRFVDGAPAVLIAPPDE